MLALASFCWSLVGIIAVVSATEFENEQTQCSLYLAETLDDRGTHTMGVFSFRDIPGGSTVGFPDLVIPLLDIPIHSSPTHEPSQEEYWRLWNELVWNSLDVGGSNEGVDVRSAALGLGSITRGGAGDPNVALLASSFDDADFHRIDDPGAGAISYYNSVKAIAIRDIKAGEELYFHRKHSFFIDPEDQERAVLESLDPEDPRVKEVQGLYDQLEKQQDEVLHGEFRTKLWGILQDAPNLSMTAQRMMPNDSIWGTLRTQQIVQPGPRDLRTSEWLQENGLCLDGLRQGPSTIPQAGRGAFATRKMEHGSVIAPAPLVHVADKRIMQMYRPRLNDEFRYDIKDVIHQQLMLNYCFGHNESTKLLCPLGPGTAFINHSPTPNAAIRWSTHSALHKQKWLNMSVEELGNKMEVGLMIEYVALRDISEGEEIFINYGPEWERAWDRHAQNWEPPRFSDHYVNAKFMNSLELEVLPIGGEDEHPYPYSVVTSCHFDYDPENLGRRDTTGTYANPRDYEVWVQEWEGLERDVPPYVLLRPCHILERAAYLTHDLEEEMEYTVQMLNSASVYKRIPDDQIVIVKRYPRQGIVFTDFPYTTDTHIVSAFRHEMMMDDGLFPNTWRNRV